MSREKQIEEMCKLICQTCTEQFGKCDPTHPICRETFREAEAIYNAGYRKQAEGKWVLVGNGNGRAIHWKCSVCGFETLDASNGNTNFCPNCGANM